MSKLRIAFLCNEYPPRRHGGIGTSVQQLARALALEGHRVVVLGWGPEPERYLDGEVAVEVLQETRIPRLGWWLNRACLRRRVLHIAATSGLDIVEGPDWTGMGAWQAFPVPYVVRLNGSATYFASVLGESVRTSVRWAERSNLRRAVAIASVSRFCWEKTQDLFGLPGTAEIIPNGVEPSLFAPRGGEDAEEEGVILYTGTLVRKKGLFELFRAFDELLQSFPRACLRLVGRDVTEPGQTQSNLQLLLGSLSERARSRVEHLGVLAHHEMPLQLHKASVCAFPSYAEALPMTWIEAMAAGKAIVASSRGPGPEVLTTQREGILVDPAVRGALSAALSRLLASRELREELGRNAQARAERDYSITTVMRRNVQWYERCCRLGNGAA